MTISESNAAIKTIRSRAYRLLRPYQVEEVEIEHAMKPGDVVVRPLLGSICHADLRYFTGRRRPESLAAKLPMALIHEGIGEIVESAAEEFQPGRRVAIVPNIPDYRTPDRRSREQLLSRPPSIEDNYPPNGRFLGSGTDGIAQSHLVLPAYCVVPIPQEVPDDIAVLTELSSISHQALQSVTHLLDNAVIAVFGDGPVGYLTAALIHHYYKVGPKRLKAFGAIAEKLDNFVFATRDLVTEPDFIKRHAGTVDIAIECAGGKYSSAAINQAIDVLKPGGILILLGVSEELVPINTRDILEKGITVLGSSRSSFRDFHAVIGAMKDPEYQKTLRRLVPDHTHKIASAEDFAAVMKHTSENPYWRKVYLQFEW